MKRFLFGVGFAVIAGILSGLIMPTALAKSTDNFTINNFDVEYHLTRDTQGRSTLKTIEHITATFPESNQNHGIERAIPESYDGHSTQVATESITDASGNILPYDDSTSSNGNKIVRIGDADIYVHGLQTYVITYVEHDVTRFFANTNDDEFYWNVNGIQWAQPIEEAHAQVFIDGSLKPAITGKPSCYQGAQGSNEACSVTTQDPSSTTPIMTFSSTRVLLPGENISIAVGFAPHTFGAYQQTWQEKIFATLVAIWVVALVIGSIIAIIVVIWIGITRSKVMSRAKGRGTIIPEYLPPKDINVVISALIMGYTLPTMTAQTLDLAVRHYIKIFQIKEKTFLSAAEYELEIVKPPTDLTREEQDLLSSLFGGDDLNVGARFEMKSLVDDVTISQKLIKNRKSARISARGQYGLFEKEETKAKEFNRVGIVMLVLGVLTLSPLVVVGGIVAFSCAYTLWPLTDKGAELRDYILGLRMYISVAEKDRIKMLQSPQGAEKIGNIDGTDTRQLVKLYERVLPYAVLFGYEKEWVKQLGAYYEAGSQQPDWYQGNGIFNAVMFSTALNTFSSQSEIYTAPTNSTLGGSSGGGFSGGGGGGGGGGGW